jgi:hypothetical protein
MSQTNQAATKQVPPTPAQQQREHLRKHLTINGAPPDEETISRILSANRHPQPTTTRGSLATSRPFSLLR